MNLHLTTLDFAVIIAYLAALSWIGLYFSQRQRSREEYFLGNRRMHWALVGGSVLATFFSSISYISLPGEAIRYGIAIFAGYIVLPLVIPVTNRILIPILTRLPITSAYEYLEKRFDLATRRLASGVFVMQTLLWSGVVIYMTSLAFSEMAGWGLFPTIVLLGLVTTFYTSVGGFRTVIWSDNFQLWILLGGAILVPLVIGWRLGSGPLGWWEVFSQAGHAETEVFSLDPTVRVTLVGNMLSIFFWYICKNGSDQMAVQRFLSMPSLREARRSTWVLVAGNAFVLFTLLLSGMALFALYSSQSGLAPLEFQAQLAGREADRLLPRFIAEGLPAGLSGLLLAAILAAAMSSLSSGINSISSVVMTEFFVGRAPAAPLLKGRDELRWDRLMAVGAGLLGTLSSILIVYSVRNMDWNLVELSSRVNHVFIAPLGVLFFGGMLFRRTGTRAVKLAFGISLAVSVFLAFGREWFLLSQAVSFTLVLPVAFLLGLFSAWLVGLALRAPEREKIEGLVWRSSRRRSA